MDSSPRSALFREIHKNTWLKRITSDVKKLTVGTKRYEKFWVVFCVHDDFDALLEGYVEPRMAPSHSPEWTVSLQQTQHISHALVPLEQEYEFVITLSSDVVRFSASSWEIMQEWVDTLRSKLREMKILSPRENIYSKLPEIRPPLLPTRDPTSPLPAPPPVPAALVPGIERINPPAITAVPSTSTSTSTTVTTGQTTPTTSAMSNTLTQNLIAMLSSPIANLRQQSDDGQASGSTSRASTSTCTTHNLTNGCASPAKKATSNSQQSLAKTFSDNVLADPNTCPPSTSNQDGPIEGSSLNGVTVSVEDRESGEFT
ncbi:serine proteinase stubble [Phlebotomus papatasi]|uniref:serine proteinase stubble n=1 Tax=Phlebotomus papatasi TaxID=29031 RepID=UPI00248408BB|nr:serine proteinase stubble [Phlebotomus papatasi]